METLNIRLLETTELPLILPIVKEFNPKLTYEHLEHCIKQMPNLGYECIGVFEKGQLIAICGFWITVRFYCGKQIEVDNVIVSSKARSKGIGSLMMDWVMDYAASIGCETCELNTYVTNVRSHKFYFKKGFEILGYHMKKDLPNA